MRARGGGATYVMLYIGRELHVAKKNTKAAQQASYMALMNTIYSFKKYVLCIVPRALNEL